MLERFEKMFKENSFSFRSEAEIAVFELHYPDVFKSESEASKAAVKFFETTLTDKRKMFAKIPQKTIDSMSLNQIDENLTAILGIEDWLEKHPDVTEMTDVSDAVRELEKALARTKKALKATLQAIPGSIAFNASNRFIRKIAEIEQKLGENS